MNTPKPRLTFEPRSEEQYGPMLERARWAAKKYAQYDRASTLRIVERVADAAWTRAQHFAEHAVQETGYGVIEHKRLKNELCSRGAFDVYKDDDWIGPKIDPQRKTVQLGRPAGVILALTPSTNPVATVFFKIILALLTRNTIIVCPHPAAKVCCSDAADHLASAASDAGAPDGVIQVVREPSIPLIETLMSDERIDLIVATGGPAVVKAAYKSGKPALGVGPGNGAVFVHDTADLPAAARRIIESKSFDNSVLCTNESVLLAERKIAAELLNQARLAGAHLCSEPEREKLRNYLWTSAGFNVAAIGKDAGKIAGAAGFSVASAVKVLIVEIGRVLPEEHFAREKLCPVLGFFVVSGIEEAIGAARLMMRKAGRGHSAAIHARDEKAIMAFSAGVPALRIVVNAPCSQGAAGFGTHLGPTMTIGTGFLGGSALGENLTPRSLMNWTTIAYAQSAAEKFGDFTGLSPWSAGPAPSGASSIPSNLNADTEALRDAIRRMVLEELSSALGRG